MTIVRVFPRRTSMTPRDDMAFVGDPPLWRPGADEVHVSVTFTWDIPEGRRLAEAWGAHYPIVRVGGPAIDGEGNGFMPGMYVKQGVTFTSRGCPNHCPWCLVKGGLRLLPIVPGHIVQDNNFLACPKAHRLAAYEMLREQPKAAIFSGGLEARLLTDEIAGELQGIRVNSVFLAADTKAALGPLREAMNRLRFLRQWQRRCYVLIAFNGETLSGAEERLEAVWQAGATPFAQLYQPSDHYIRYDRGWKALARTWSRPAIMAVIHGGWI